MARRHEQPETENTDPVDLVLYQPASEMVAAATSGPDTPVKPRRRHITKNPTPRSRSKKPAWQLAQDEIVAPYAGVEHLLVRTAIVRAANYSPEKMPKIGSSSDAFRMLAHLKHDPQENFVVLCLDSQNRVMAIYPAFVGTASATMVDPAVVYRVPMLLGAAAIIVVHNHPSGRGDEPSDADYKTTQELKKKGACMGIALLDHLIIGHDGNTSFLDRGWL